MNLLARWSIRDRLLFGNIALVAGSLLLFAICARFVIATVILNGLDAPLEAQAKEFAQHPHRSLPQPNGPPQGDGEDILPPPRQDGPDGEEPLGPEPVSRLGGQDGEIRHLRNKHGLPVFRRPLYLHVGADGNAMASLVYSPLGFQKVIQTHHGLWRDDYDIESDEVDRVFSLPLRDQQGNIIAVVQTAAPRTDTDRAIKAVTSGLTLLLPVVALLAGGGGILLTRRALIPVRRLADAAARIEANRLSDRLPETGGNDEFDRLTHMLNTSLARLEESFARQKRFAADASHELRTPLAVIKTATSMLQEEGFPQELQKETLRDADEAVDRATRLIADLLFFARTEGGTLPVRVSRVPIAERLTRVTREAETAFRRTGNLPATITVEASPMLTLLTDADLLGRIVLNLLGNALRHTPTEGKIAVTAQVDRQGITVAVQDTGSGIAPEHLARLGEPFYRPDRARGREDGGAGLGLSITRGIAQTLGGTHTIESELGHGTTVTVHLPNYRITPDSAA